MKDEHSLAIQHSPSIPLILNGQICLRHVAVHSEGGYELHRTTQTEPAKCVMSHLGCTSYVVDASSTHSKPST